MQWAIITKTAIAASILLLHSACERAAPRSAGNNGFAAETAPVSPVRTLVEAPSVGMTTARDAEEAREVLKFISSNYSGSGEAIFYRGGTNATHIDVYGVLLPVEQDKIVGLVQAEIPKRKWKQIYIIFRDQERWVDQEDGWSSRSGEQDLYSVVIKRL